MKLGKNNNCNSVLKAINTLLFHTNYNTKNVHLKKLGTEIKWIDMNEIIKSLKFELIK